MSSQKSLFCTSCNNLLTTITKSDLFIFKCNQCNKDYQPNMYDTLVYEYSKEINISSHKNIFLNAELDPANPVIEKKCTCGCPIMKQVRVGPEMKQINICVLCKERTV